MRVPSQPRARWLRALLVIAGLALQQVALYWPCVTGEKILLPLDVLQQRGIYLPRPADGVWKRAADVFVSDLVLHDEVNRRFAVDEMRAGRLPLWNPYNYAGSPFLAADQTALFSPYRLIDYLWPSPRSLAWSQLLRSVVGGVGAYLFFRRAMRVGFWPAAVGCWLFPQLGYQVQWTGFTLTAVASLLPWVLLATDAAVRRPRGLGGPGLGVAVAILLVSGHSANAGHVLLASGLYMLWCVLDTHAWAGLQTRRAAASAAAVLAGWALGALLAAPQLLPTLEYMQSSARILARTAGYVETPPQGLAALLQLIMPHVYGLGTAAAPYLVRGNRLESMATGYVGMVTLLVMAPLSCRLIRLRGMLCFWLTLALIGMIQPLGLFGTEHLFDLPLLNRLRNNRLILLTGWSILAAAVMGLEVLRTEGAVRRRWLWTLVGAALLLAAYNAVRALLPDTALDAALDRTLQATPEAQWPAVRAGYAQVLGWFAAMHWWYAGTALLCAALCLAIRWPHLTGGVLVVVLGAAAVAEVMANAWGVAAQRDAALYYPRIDVLARLAERNDGRAVGLGCCPASLNLVHRLRDIRGYDGADPLRMVELLQLFAQPGAGRSPAYALAQSFVPDIRSPLLDMLNVKYLFERVPLADDPDLRELYDDGDYRVLQNLTVLPRAWVPSSAHVVNDKPRRLELLQRPDFAPAETVYLETDAPLALRDCAGSAAVVAESANELTIDVDMRTDGVLVMSEAWDPGWRAWVDGTEVEVMVANHALRAVQVGKQARRIVMRYQPRSFTLGVWLAGAAALAILLWSALAIVVGDRNDYSRPVAAPY